jgi:hypothetical protein
MSAGDAAALCNGLHALGTDRHRAASTRQDRNCCEDADHRTGDAEEHVAAIEQLTVRLASTPTAAIHSFLSPLANGAGRISWKHLDGHLASVGVRSHFG